MKVLTLNYEFPPVGGGGGRLCAQVASGLAARGHEVRVITPGMAGLEKRTVAEGVSVERHGCLRRKRDTCSVLEMGLTTAACFPAATKVVRVWVPDVIHTHFVVPTGLLGWAIARRSGIPHVITAHLGDVPGGVPEQTASLFRVVRPVAGRIWREAAAVTAVSSHVADLAEAAYGRRPEVILNGIEPPPRPPAKPTGLPVRCVMIGRLSVQKNPVLAIEALSGLPVGTWSLDVVGDGPLRGMVESRVRSGMLPVTMHGWLDAEQVTGMMERAHVLVMPSRSEGLPMAAIEALWKGLVIVGSDIGGLRDVVSSGRNGFLCPQTPHDFATALRQLIDQPELLSRMSTASLDLAGSFNLRKSVEQYEQVFCSARAGN